MRQFIILVVILFYSCTSTERGTERPEQMNDGIETGTPQEVGINQEILKLMTDSINLGVYPNIH